MCGYVGEGESCQVGVSLSMGVCLKEAVFCNLLLEPISSMRTSLFKLTAAAGFPDQVEASFLHSSA